jgi:hypothetical protein
LSRLPCTNRAQLAKLFSPDGSAVRRLAANQESSPFPSSDGGSNVSPESALMGKVKWKICPFVLSKWRTKAKDPVASKKKEKGVLLKIAPVISHNTKPAFRSQAKMQLSNRLL